MGAGASSTETAAGHFTLHHTDHDHLDEHYYQDYHDCHDDHDHHDDYDEHYGGGLELAAGMIV